MLTLLADVVLALPGLLLVLMLAAIAPGSWWALYAGLSLTLWVEYFRYTRQRARIVLSQPSVEASQLLGFNQYHIIKRHLLPEIGPGLLTIAAFGLATAVAALGFVSVGIRPPTAANAPVLIAHEPTKGLTPRRSAKVVGLLADVPRQGGTLLAITHEISVAKRLGGSLLVLKSGNLVEHGPTEQVLAQPSAAYTQKLLDAEPQAWPKLPSVETGALLLDANNLTICRDERVLLHHFDLCLHAGERVAITGPSGVGKTSLLDVLAGLKPPDSGIIQRTKLVTKTGIQKLYQDPPAAFPVRVTLGESLRDVAQLHHVKWSEVTDHLSQLGIDLSLLDRRPDAVSGGELQRISIVRALTANPSILLADEPTSRRPHHPTRDFGHDGQHRTGAKHRDSISDTR